MNAPECYVICTLPILFPLAEMQSASPEGLCSMQVVVSFPVPPRKYSKNAFNTIKCLHFTSFIESIILTRQSFKTTTPFNIIRAINQQNRQSTYKSNIEAHSCNHGCNKKSNKHYIFWVCVCSLMYPVCKQHAPYRLLLPLCLYHIFIHFLLNGKTFVKRYWNYIKYLFGSCLQVLCEAFLVPTSI